MLVLRRPGVHPPARVLVGAPAAAQVEQVRAAVAAAGVGVARVLSYQVAEAVGDGRLEVILRDDLGLSPEPETDELYLQIIG